MKYKIVSDSASNLTSLAEVPFASVPLHIIVGEHDFCDDENLDLSLMQQTLSAYRGKTGTACPSPNTWIEAFGDADAVFCVTITSGLSGSYASAMAAKQIFEEEHPDRAVHIIDSLSTGPEMALIIEKLRSLILSDMEHAQIAKEMAAYCKRTHLLFSLASLDNLARNGRVNPLVAKGIGLLGIRVIGKASDEGTLQPLNKRRGDKKAIENLIEHMKELGYKGGKVIISHTGNLPCAEELKTRILAEFGKFNGFIHENRGLCGYYAEPMSVLLGFES